ncbi:MAG TPA: hypothetical protein VMF13_03140, partial [Luteitalea sp.]|nr:hypothetical protein [Luteitalea sp.]
ALLFASAAGVWALDTHQPPPWPDALMPWAAFVQATTPMAGLVDRVNRIAITPDLPLASAALLVVAGLSMLALLRAVAVPTQLALATAAGFIACRSIWSTATTGADALPTLAVLGVVLASIRPRHPLWMWASVALLIVVAPWLAWPAVVALMVARSGRTRTVAGVVVPVAALLWMALLSAWAMQGLPGRETSSWSHALWQVLLPGASASASSWVALRQAWTVIVGDVHLFGLALAVLGACVAAPELHRMRRTTVGWVAGVAITVAVGAVSPSMGAASLLPWWGAWAAIGSLALVARVAAHQRRVAMVFVVAAAITLPLLRHATVVPGPWVAGHPAIARAAASTFGGGWLAGDDPIALRRWRTAGFATMPSDGSAMTSALASGARVAGVGASLRLIEALGFERHEEALRAPLAAVIHDVRPDQLVALGLSGPSLPYLGPAGTGALSRLGVARNAVISTASMALAVRSDVGGRVQSARDGTEIALRTGSLLGERQLVDDLHVLAHADRAEIDGAIGPIVTGATAAIAVFDRTQEIVLRSAAERAPGLPFPLGTMPAWQHALVTGTPGCVGGREDWLALRGASRIGVPVVAASPRAPLVAYVASQQRPFPAVIGLPHHPVWVEWDIRSFDPGKPDDVAALAALTSADGMPGAGSRPDAWWTRLEVRPRDPWHAPLATLVAGTDGDWWVRPSGARGAASRRICRQVASGERLLLGQYGAVDDDSAHELDVWAASGWHAPERSRTVVHQWSAQPTASVGFRVVAPRDLTLALDASPARGPLAIAINGTLIAADWQGAGRLAIPAALVRTGQNMLTLSVPEVMRPARDPRTLGVDVRQFRLLRAP